MPGHNTKKSLKESRKNILIQMTSKAEGKTEERVILFQNDDVPKFLDELDKFESDFRKTSIMIK